MLLKRIIPCLDVDRGRVVVFTEDPNFRAYWRGAQRLFLNAVVLGPSAP